MKKDDSFGVELDLNIIKFKNKMKEATTVSTEFAKNIEKTRHFGQNAFGDIVEIKEFSNEIAKQNKLYAEQKKILSSVSKLNKNKSALFNLGTANLIEGNNYSGFIASFKKATVEEKKEIKELNNEIEYTGKVTKQVGSEISQAFNKGLKSVKKLTLGFLGVRTAFSLFRKYMSNYQSQNEEFANKMQLTTNVITNALAPAFELFANVIQYVVIGLARVVELLFGVNILGKTVDNSLKGASQSAKELNENLSGLDEISNIDQSTGAGLSTGIESQLKALEEFKKKIIDVENFFKKFKIDKFLLGVKDVLGKIINWSIEHPNVIATILGGYALIKLIGGIMGTAGGTGLLGLVANLKTIATMGAIGITIYVGYKLAETIDEFFEKAKEPFLKDAKEVEDKVEELETKVINVVTDTEKTKKDVSGQFDDSLSEMDTLLDKIDRSGKGSLDTFTQLKSMLTFSDKAWDLDKKIQVEGLYNVYSQLQTLYETNKLNSDQTEKYKDVLKKIIDYKNRYGNVLQFSKFGFDDQTMQNIKDTYQYLVLESNKAVSQINTGFDPLFQRFKEKYTINLDTTKANQCIVDINNATETIPTKLYNTENEVDNVLKKMGFFGQKIKKNFEKKYEFNFDLSKAKEDISSFEKNTRNKLSTPFTLKLNADTTEFERNTKNSLTKFSSIFKVFGINIPSYDIGSNYIPRDQIAMVHEGERIIPKKYNNSEYLGNLGNSETNDLLIELNKSVLEFAKRPSVISVNGKELAKATYNDYQEESARRGTNISVRRV